MRKLFIVLLAMLFMNISRPVIIENLTSRVIWFSYYDSQMSQSYIRIMPGIKKDIGNDPIEALAVADAVKIGSNMPNINLFAFGGNATEFSTSISKKELDPIRNLLSKLPQAIIKIISDPEMRNRPKAIFPDQKELEEMLDKENKPKIKPLIQEAGQLLPTPVNVPGPVSEIAVDYVA